MLIHRQDIHVRWTTTYETKSPDMEECSDEDVLTKKGKKA